MSGDPTYIINAASSIAQIAILAVGIYRALVMRRGFIDATYRSRALWSTFLMVVIAVTNTESFVTLPNDVLSNLVGFVPFIAIVVVSFAFVDRTVLVATRSDFFHRDALRWLQVRVPASATLAASSVFVIAAIVATSQFASSGLAAPAPLWADVGFNQFFFVVAAILGYSAAALIVSARRTPDRTLRRSIRLLGLALGSFVVSLVLSTIIPSDPGILLGDGFTLLATYVLYLSVMSLTSLGKVERDS